LSRLRQLCGTEVRDTTRGAVGVEVVESLRNRHDEAWFVRQVFAENFLDAEKRRHKASSVRVAADGDKPGREWISYIDGHALLVGAGRVAHPGGDGEGAAVDRSTFFQALPRRFKQALRQLLRAVHGDLPCSMMQIRIAETPQQRVLVLRKVGLGRNRQGRGYFLVHQSPDEGVESRST